MRANRLRGNIILGSILLALVFAMLVLFDTERRTEHLRVAYEELRSPTVLDRSGVIISQRPNARGHYHTEMTALPDRFVDTLLAKEDRWFYYHPGINPVSIARAISARIHGTPRGGASTISQQLVKILLAQEQERTIANKLRELYYTFALELNTDKDTILTMYANAVYLGNQTQGFEAASRLYFGDSVSELTESEWARLLATLSRPSTRNPWTVENSDIALVLASALGLSWQSESATNTRGAFNDPVAQELASLPITCPTICHTTIDLGVTRDLRAILSRNMPQLQRGGANSGALVVLSVPENEIIALIGSPDPFARSDGAAINMAIAPRPVGSTIKPLLYLKGFQSGLRPYTLVNDAEYRFPIKTGYALYPKNFDGQYRGEVTLHYALANSLNVPTVKVLEYIGLDSFYRFLRDDLTFSSIQPLEEYQYGIALGGLEMDLLTLTHYLSLFPAGGVLNPLSLVRGVPLTAPQSHIEKARILSEPSYVELVTTIMSDRETGVEQFGRAGNLALPFDNYGVKTGTSRDYHDSWVVGFTPDYIVGVWIGNTNNTPLAGLTGQSGAGSVWRQAMEYLATTAYYSNAPLSNERLETYLIDGSLEYGLPGDRVLYHRAIMSDTRLIRSPYDGDQFLFSAGTGIPLISSSEDTQWRVNGKAYGAGLRVEFRPHAPGEVTISAHTVEQDEEITIRLSEEMWELNQ